MNIEKEVLQAEARIRPHIRETPLDPSPHLSRLGGAEVFCKLENLQHTGSFKTRGAMSRLTAMSPEERARGVVAASTGNHGLAVAHVAGKLDLRAVICLSEGVPQNKVDALEDLGAEIVIRGASYDEAMAHACSLQKEQGLTMIHPFDDPFIIAGQGTVGLELLEDLPAIETAVVPLSGGGLISGIALALKSAKPGVRVAGVSMDRAPVMVHSLRAGKVIEMEEEETLADALVGGIGPINRYTFRLCQEIVDETVLVSEGEIAEAMAFALVKHHVAVEGGGAVGIAALLHDKVQGLGQNVAVVISGGNVDPSLLLDVTKRYRH